MTESPRAITPQQKRALVERLLDAWLQAPHLRLGQLVHVATFGRDIFSTEDAELLAQIECFSKYGIPKR